MQLSSASLRLSLQGWLSAFFVTHEECIINLSSNFIWFHNILVDRKSMGDSSTALFMTNAKDLSSTTPTMSANFVWDLYIVDFQIQRVQAPKKVSINLIFQNSRNENGKLINQSSNILNKYYCIYSNIGQSLIELDL